MELLSPGPQYSHKAKRFTFFSINVYYCNYLEIYGLFLLQKKKETCFVCFSPSSHLLSFLYTGRTAHDLSRLLVYFSLFFVVKCHRTIEMIEITSTTNLTRVSNEWITFQKSCIFFTSLPQQELNSCSSSSWNQSASSSILRGDAIPKHQSTWKRVEGWGNTCWRGMERQKCCDRYIKRFFCWLFFFFTRNNKSHTTSLFSFKLCVF